MLSRTARPALRAIAAVPTRAPAANAAGYATLREIEGRLKSIRNIEKITKTMKVVASTKLTRAQRAMNEARVYGEASNAVYESAETKPLDATTAAAEGAAAGQKKTLLIVCSSDKGLCGGIHSNLSRAVRRIINEDSATHYDLVVIGEKAKAQLSRTHARNIVVSFSGIGKETPAFSESQAVAGQVGELDGDYAEVKIVYNRFINAQSYETSVLDVYSEEAIAQSPKYSVFEIEDDTLPNLRDYGLANSLHWALAEGHACENSARRNAMDNASKNAGEMISKYQILFNRTRQAVITGELVEIITGATASADM